MKSQDLLKTWLTGLRIRHSAHYQAAVRCERGARLMGVPAVIISTAVGTSIFAGMVDSMTWKIMSGLLSFAAAVLASVQTVLKFPELAAQHKAAAQKYGRLRRKVEVLLTAANLDEKETAKALNEIRDEWNTIDEQSPNISQSVYDKAEKEIHRHTTPESDKGITMQP